MDWHLAFLLQKDSHPASVTAIASSCWSGTIVAWLAASASSSCFVVPPCGSLGWARIKVIKAIGATIDLESASQQRYC